MPQHRDPRYRGRKHTTAKRRLGHLRTNYVEDDMEAFSRDLERLRTVWSESVLESDRKAATNQFLKTTAIVCGIVMVPVTALLVWMILDGAISWWLLPIVQSAIIIFFLLRMSFMWDPRGNDTTFLIYREADRRGVKYIKRETPLYHIMNRLNADYNSQLWNRNFNWG